MSTQNKLKLYPPDSKCKLCKTKEEKNKQLIAKIEQMEQTLKNIEILIGVYR